MMTTLRLQAPEYSSLQIPRQPEVSARHLQLEALDCTKTACTQSLVRQAIPRIFHGTQRNFLGKNRIGVKQHGKVRTSTAKAELVQQRESDHSTVPTERRAGLVEEKPLKKDRKYSFHAEHGGHVRAVVSKAETCYKVVIEVSLIADIDGEEALYLHWGLFRSNSSDWILLDPESMLAGTTIVAESMRTPFKLGWSGVHTLELEFGLDHVPFFIGFVLYQPSSSKRGETWIRNILNPNFCIPVGFGKGRPDPLGPTAHSDGSMNFALYSKNAENVILCLYDAESTEPSLEIDLDRSIHRTGDIWHIELDNLGIFTRYGYRCKGEVTWERGNRFHPRRILLDPYAKFLAPFVLGQDSLPSPATVLGLLTEENIQFDWEDDTHPNIPLESIVAYRLNVTRFTADKSSGLQESLRGTFEGLVEKVQHLKNLGVNAVILQPIFAFDKSKGCFHPLSFFAPMDCFGHLNDSISASFSLRKMVKELHKLGIEVLLDVVYSHTAENNDKAPQTISFRGIDNATYYILDQNGKVAGSELGSGNSLNCNHPVVQTMILDSLRYWVTEYHIDGFCFANAPALITGPHGQELSRPLTVEAITFDPVLANRKLIVDSCSPFTGLCKDFSFPHWKRWCMWNSRYRDDVRQFMRGDKGQLSSFATRLCGSGDLFSDGRGPNFSINFVTSPYGLTLVDLVSYSAEAEADTELSWNCGEEGRTLNQAVLDTRLKQVRNFLMCLFLSQGVPVLNMGDEYGHTKGGSVFINERKAFNWDALKLDFGLQTTHLIASLAAFRLRRKDLLQCKDFIRLENVKWHAAQLDEPKWESLDSSFLAVSLQPRKVGMELQPALGDLYIGFNSQEDTVIASLPEPPEGMIWYRIADTSLPYPENFVEDGLPINVPKGAPSSFGIYEIQSHSSVLLEARVAA